MNKSQILKLTVNQFLIAFKHSLQKNPTNDNQIIKAISVTDKVIDEEYFEMFKELVDIKVKIGLMETFGLSAHEVNSKFQIQLSHVKE